MRLTILLLAGMAACGGFSSEKKRTDGGADRKASVERKAGSERAASTKGKSTKQRSETKGNTTRRAFVESDEMIAAEIDALEALGYLDGVMKAGETSGVTVHDPERAMAGTNLVVSGHGFEIVLLDMDGETLHTWQLDKRHRKAQDRANFRRAWLLDDGGLLTITEGRSMYRLDVNGKVLWQKDDGNHHDVHVQPDGSLVGLTRTAHVVKWWTKQPVLEDAVTFYTSEGEELSSVSILKAVATSEIEPLIALAKRKGRDPLHVNSVKVLDGSLVDLHPAFAKGNLLMSCRAVSTLVVVDPKTRQVVWYHHGDTSRQHDAKIDPHGRLMVFDNNLPDGPSLIKAFTLPDMELAWSYGPEEGADGSFFSKTCSTATQLPNGNIMSTASNPGIAFEITPEGERVWEYYSPFRAGTDDELVANLFDVIRTPPVEELTWLKDR